ncbi:MAG TPA: hypothetical protein VHD87_08285, partial [Acidimicrobiales bacterium]|nr:hypothetical protein [Acidimicrobiales bacterium]
AQSCNEGRQMGYEAEERIVLRGLAAKQQGLFTGDQALTRSLSKDQLATDVKYGLIEKAYPSVYALTGFGWTPARRYLATTLAGGLDAMSTHRAGTWLWGLTSFEQRPEISIPAHRLVQLKGVRVHRVADLPSEPVFRLGVPTTGVERVLIDAAAVLTIVNAREALDRAIARRLTTPARVLAELQHLARRGRRGVGTMRRLLDDAGVTGSHAPSVLEAKTRRLIDRAGLPQPHCEFVAGENGEYRLDFVWPELMLALEVEGWQYHSSFEAFRRGMSRQNRLTIEGWGFLRYSWLHVTRNPQEVVRQLRAAFEARTALFS